MSISLIAVFLFGMLVQHYFSSDNTMDKEHSDGSTNTAQKKPLYWVAPMDPTYRRDKPGKSPMGMDLVAVYPDSNQNANLKNSVHISPTVEHNLGVRLAPVLKENLSNEINTVGYVMEDENRIEHIHTYTNGWVKQLFVKTTGEHVKKGQLLLALYSPTLVNAQDEYLLALKSKNKSLVTASRKKLLTLGMGKKQIQQ